MDKKVMCSDIDDTVRLAQTFAPALRKEDIVLFYGDLGAGKTFFIKELCSFLGIEKEHVTSPSFGIVKTYHSARADLCVHHFDFYRMRGQEEADFFEMEDYLDMESIVFVEWADRLSQRSFPGRVLTITIKILGETQREFIFEPWLLSD